MLLEDGLVLDEGLPLSFVGSDDFVFEEEINEVVEGEESRPTCNDDDVVEREGLQLQTQPFLVAQSESSIGVLNQLFSQLSSGVHLHQQGHIVTLFRYILLFFRRRVVGLT
jgi:hypothetical protein